MIKSRKALRTGARCPGPDLLARYLAFDSVEKVRPFPKLTALGSIRKGDAAQPRYGAGFIIAADDRRADRRIIRARPRQIARSALFESLRNNQQEWLSDRAAGSTRTSRENESANS